MKKKKTVPFFDWMEYENPVDPKHFQEQFVRMYESEIRQRTKLLMNLHYDRRAIHKRIKQNIRWEFELCELPVFYNSVGKIIDSVISSHSKNVKRL
jgi:hypothetical protein